MNNVFIKLTRLYRYYIIYLFKKIKFDKYIDKCIFYTIVVSFVSFLLEPYQFSKACFFFLRGVRKEFHIHGLNPREIGVEQAIKRPILLLHADRHNQSAWIELAKSLQLGGLGPVYTLNLPHGKIDKRDRMTINRKIEQIKLAYREHGAIEIEIDLIGHSRGAEVAVMAAWSDWDSNGHRLMKRSQEIGRVIKLGSLFQSKEIEEIKAVDENFAQRSYEVIGLYDFILADSLLDPSHQARVDSGHLGVLYSAEAHRCLIHWLSMRSQ